MRLSITHASPRSSTGAFLTCAVLAAISLPAVSTAQQFLRPGSGLLPTAPGARLVGAADLDDDGRPELLDSRPFALSNLGGGRFGPPRPFGSSFHAFTFVDADFDGNGSTDLLWYSPGTTPVLQQRFASHFVDTPVPFAMFVDLVRAGDIDGDGDQDLATLSGLSSLTGIRRYVAGGPFAEDPAAGWPGSHGGRIVDLRFADVDGDGDLDLVDLTSTKVRTFANDGRGRFALQDEATVQGGAPGFLAMADVDGDGAVDAVVLDHSGRFSPYRNDGSGRFRRVDPGAPNRPGTPRRIDLVDADGDGDVDVVVTHDDVVVFRNDGSGLFPVATTVATDLPPRSAPIFRDFDADGRTDFVLTAGPELYLQGADGRFRRVDRAPMPRTGRAAEIYVPTDIDGDGDPDLFGNRGRTATLLLNDGGQGFVDVSTRLPEFLGAIDTVAAEDLDRDGDDDLLLAMRLGGTHLLRNDGAAGFRQVPTVMAQDNDVVAEIACGDLDGDGLPDVVVAGARGLDIFLNRMPRGFERTSGAPVGLQNVAGLELADLDGDGDLDLLLGFAGHPPMQGHVRRYDNSGPGLFREVRGLPGVGRGPVDGVDFDRDGDVDVLVGNQLFENDGAGGLDRLPTARLPAFLLGTERTVVADVDGDGYPDLVSAAAGGIARRNDGLGGFVEHDVEWMGSMPSRCTDIVAAVDVDLDGDDDLVTVDDLGDDLLLSQRRGLRPVGLVTTGGTAVLELRARGPDAVVQLLAAAGRGPVRPLRGLGRLQLDAATLFALAVVPVDGAAAAATRVEWSLPRDPALVGSQASVQALFVDRSLASASLSNAVDLVVLR